MIRFNGTDGIPVYINPKNVVGLRPVAESTWIHVNTPNQNGWPFAFVVSEQVEEVARRIGEQL